MDIVLIILSVAVLFALALAGTSLYDIFLAWKKAKSYGMSLNFEEVRSLTKFYKLEDQFLKSCAEFKALDPSISVRDIVRHHMADGDTLALLENWKEVLKKGTDISFKSVVLLHLAGKNISESIDNLSRIYEIRVANINEKELSVDYCCHFKIKPESANWVVIDYNKFSEIIREKIVLALLTGDISDYEMLSEFIKKEYLNDQFWDELCHGIVVKQEITISK